MRYSMSVVRDSDKRKPHPGPDPGIMTNGKAGRAADTNLSLPRGVMIMFWKKSTSVVVIATFINTVLLMTWQGVRAAAAPDLAKPQTAGVQCVLRSERTTYHP